MMHGIRENHPLKRMFSGLIEQAFMTDLGVCSPELTNYLSNLLVSFVHVDRLHAIRDAEGRRLSQVGAMLAALDDGPVPEVDEHNRQIHRHIGDYALFWAGIYPERFSQLRRRPTYRDHLIDYVAQGKRSYAIASDLTGDNCLPPAWLLNRLSQEFESCVHGLHAVRRGWEERDPASWRERGELLY